MMKLNWTIILVVVACCCITISAALLFRDTEAEAKISIDMRDPPPPPPPPPPPSPPPPPPAAADTSAPTKTSEPQSQPIVQFNGVTIMHQRVPLLDLGHESQRYYLVPGAHFPGLQGLRLDDAVRLVMTSFPTLTVRAIMIGEPVSYEYRRDRLTVQYDSFTKRVVSARVG